MLPAAALDFRSPQYWRSFFEARGGVSFEWYGGAANVLPVLMPAVPPAGADSRALVVGCGNSALSEDLWAAGYTSALSIDFDAGVVEEMRRKTGARCPGLEWAAEDATTALLGGGFPVATFAAVVDKGLLDALLPEEGCDEAAVEGALRYLRGAARVLEPGRGALLLVSLLQGHVLRLLLRHVAEDGSAWGAVEMAPFESDSGGGGADLLAFCVLLRRSAAPWPSAGAAGAAAAGVPLRLRALTFSAPAGRSGGPSLSAGAAEVLLRADGSGDGATAAAVTDAQLAYTLRCKLRRVTGSTYEKLDVWASDGSGAAVGAVAPAGARPEALGLPPGAAPLYTVFVVDGPAADAPLRPPPAPPKGALRAPHAARAAPQRFAVLLVPVGREHEWAFGSAGGQASLACRAGVARLLVVQLGSGGAAAARFSRMTAGEVQAELSPVALAMLPPGAAGAAIPFLSVGDPGTLSRLVVAEGTSAVSGGFTVEEVAAAGGGGGALRRLVFSSNRGALQSEVLRPAGGCVDPAAPLRFGYHRTMAAGVRALLLPPPPGEGGARLPLLVLGLGGGALPSFLAATLPWAAVYAVEVDEEVARVAGAHFGLPAAPGEPLRVAPGGGEDNKDERAAAAALGAAFLPESHPPVGTVRVVLGDALRAVELLAHAACPPAARPAAVLVDVNAGAGELRLGLSFPPRAFVTKVFLGRLRGALREGGGLLALNLGARGALRGAVLGAVARAFAEDGPAAVVAAGEEEDDDEEGDGGELNCVVLAGGPLQRLRGAGVAGYAPRGLSWLEA